MTKPTRREENIHAPRIGARTEPVSLCSLAVAAVLAWEKAHCPDTDLTAAMAALRTHLGPLVSVS